MNTRFNRYWDFYKTHKFLVQLFVFVVALALMYTFIPGMRYGRMRSDLATPPQADTGPQTTTYAAPLDCKQVDTDAYMKQFDDELAAHQRALLTSGAPAWVAFQRWIKAIPCIDGYYAEGIVGAWETGITDNFDGFMEYYRSEGAERPQLKMQVEAIYNAGADDVITADSAKKLRELLAKNCPPEFKDLCSQKPAEPKN